MLRFLFSLILCAAICLGLLHTKLAHKTVYWHLVDVWQSKVVQEKMQLVKTSLYEFVVEIFESPAKTDQPKRKKRADILKSMHIDTNTLVRQKPTNDSLYDHRLGPILSNVQKMWDIDISHVTPDKQKPAGDL